MLLKLTQNNATALWNPNCGVESVNGINEHIIRNSVRNSVFSRLCNISSTTFTKVLELIEGMFGTISEVFEKSSVLVQPKVFVINSCCALVYTSYKLNLEYCAPLLFCSNDNIKKRYFTLENRCLKNINQLKLETRKSFNIYPIPLRHKYMYMLTYYKLIHELVPIVDTKLLPDIVTRVTVGDGPLILIKT